MTTRLEEKRERERERKLTFCSFFGFCSFCVQEFISLRSAALTAPPPLAMIRSLTLVRPTQTNPHLLPSSPFLLIPNKLIPPPASSSSSQSTIYSPTTNLILHVYPLPWLVQTYFLENALVPEGLLHSVVELAQDDFPRPWGRAVKDGGTGREGPTLGEAVGVFEQRVSGVSAFELSFVERWRKRGRRRRRGTTTRRVFGFLFFFLFFLSLRREEEHSELTPTSLLLWFAFPFFVWVGGCGSSSSAPCPTRVRTVREGRGWLQSRFLNGRNFTMKRWI